MPLLMATLRPPVTRASGIKDPATLTAVGSLEAWATELVRQLSKLDVSAGGALVGGVSSVSAGAGITVSPTTGAAVVSWSSSGTANRLAKFLTASTVGDSSITDTGALVTVANPMTVTGAITGQSTLTLTPMTQGSVLFVGASGVVTQDNAGLFYDDTNNQLRVTTSAAAQAIRAISSNATSGTVSIQNTNVSGPADFFALDNAGTARMSFGHGNASYSDSARAGRSYLWRESATTFVFARTGVVDGVIDSSGRFGIGTATSLDGNATLLHVNAGSSGALAPSTNSVVSIERNSHCFVTIKAPGASQKGLLFGNPSSGADGGILYDAAAVRGLEFRTGGNVSRATIDSAGKLTALFDLQADGNVTLNDASTDTTRVNGYAGFGAAPDANAQLLVTQATTRQYGVYLTNTASAATSNRAGLNFSMAGTFNTTAGALINYGVLGSATATRSAGANNLTNIAVYGDASGGQVNYSFFGNAGTLYNAGALQVDGNATLGNATTDAHTVSGNVTITASDVIQAKASSVARHRWGDDTGSASGGLNGLLVTAYLDGNNYVDSKVITGGTTNFRCGANTETGSARNWLAVTNSTGNAVFGFDLSCNGNATLGNADTDTHTVNGLLTFAPPGSTGSGRQTFLRIQDSSLGATANDSAVIQWNLGNGTDVYNVWVGSKTTASSPSFLNPKFIVAVQNAGTTGTANTTERFQVTNAGADVTGAFTVSSTLAVTGASTFTGAVQVNNTLTTTGNATLGDSNSTDSHRANGKLVVDGLGYAAGTAVLDVWGSTSLGVTGGGTDYVTLNAGPQIHTGSGSPESVITAPVGSLFLRTNGGAGTTLYVKESGTGNTGWVAK